MFKLKIKSTTKVVDTKKKTNANHKQRGMLFFQTKKAVSPLIATVLLIAFTVALGAVVMNWGRGYVEETAAFAKEKSNTQIGCAMDLGLKFHRIGGVLQVCYNDTTPSSSLLKFTIENSGTRDIEKIQATLIGEKQINVTEIENSTIGKAYIQRFNITYDNGTLGSMQQLKVTPFISVDGKDTPCASNAVTAEDIAKC